ncbi:calcium-binding protein [Pseudomonas fluorescens]|uniref:calcium-binding protein n=1 Tax=Pseudomonas fluorescens TaxID=294 RepID=UPI0006905C38|nr:calcium-binding protein [Pseudomonas fluorescens]
MPAPEAIDHLITQENSVEVSDIGMHANERTSSTLDYEPERNKDPEHSKPESGRRKPGQLKMLDDLYGPFKIGPYTITRRGLDALGATIDGVPLTGNNTHFRTPGRSFINALQLSYPEIEKRMKVSTFGDDYLLPSLLFELSSVRPPSAPPVIRDEAGGNVDESGYRKKMCQLLNLAQKLDLRPGYSSKQSNPSWLAIKSFSTVGASVGIQSFGILMGIRGIYDAVKKNDRDEIIFNSIGIGTEVGSIITDVVVTKVGQRMIEASSGALKDFAKTSAGIKLSRSGGLIGGALTLPFDIYSAYREFSAASNKTGKEAMDHYVSGGLNIASAAMTVILGAAAMAGFSAAGPVGLAAGAIMAIGSQVYGAVRMVDEIDDYIELTLEERWRTGWFSFVFFLDIDQDIKNRYELAKAKIETAKRLQKTARTLLDETHKDTTEAVVHGRYEHRMNKRREPATHWSGVKTNPIVYVPEMVSIDDTIDAGEGVTAQTPGAVLGIPGENKGVIWMIGDGNDSIVGVRKKPNTFYSGRGTKILSGGDKDDKFVAQYAAGLIQEYYFESGISTLKGGDGSDTLVMDGKQIYPAENRKYSIDLAAGTVEILSTQKSYSDKEYIHKTELESIENVYTLSGGSSIVTGTADSNIIMSRGRDTINAGAGDDTIYLLKDCTKAFGGPGKDFYHVALPEGWVCITEDGIDESQISLGWRRDHILGWNIIRNALTLTLEFDFHYGRRSTLHIEDVYKKVDGQRQLINNKLTFVTRDGYHLRPDLPETIELEGDTEITAESLKDGYPERTVFLHESVCKVPTLQNTNYYVQRHNKHTQFITGSDPDSFYGTRIFLDFDSHELTSAHVAFATTPSSETNKLAKEGRINVSCDFLFYFGEHLLHIVGYGQCLETTLELALPEIMDNTCTHGYMLVFRDKKSHTLILEGEYAKPPAHYKHSNSASTLTSHDLRFPLRMHHKATFELPESSAFKLDHVPSCVNLKSVDALVAIDNIEGAGATYLVHLREHRVLRISTPGGLQSAAIRLNNSSTWELDATKLGKFKVILKDNKLHIGTVTIHLPDYGPEDLVDQIFVIGPKGVVHTVDLTFESVRIDSLDARYFEPLTGSQLPDELVPFARLQLRARNAFMKNGSRGTLRYSLQDRKWMLAEAGNSREVSYSDLHVAGRCKHQSANVPNAELSDE